MVKILSRTPNPDVYIVTKSSPEHYSNSEIKNKEIGEEIQPLNDYEQAIIVFDDVLGSTTGRYKYQLFIGGKHNNLYICYLSQPYSILPKRTKRNISNNIILLNQTTKDIENI